VRAPSEPWSGKSTDLEALAKNLARMVEQGGKALAAYLKPREAGRIESDNAELIDMVKTLGHVAEYWLSDPQRSLQLQSDLGRGFLELWAQSARRLTGEDPDPVITPDPRDKRFSDPEWTSNQFFDFLKQAYLLTAQFSHRLVNDAHNLDPLTRQKAEFYMRQIVNAIAPSNFVLTNPELLRDTLSSKGENLARGMHMLAEDIQAGGGDLRIRQTDTSFFEVGRNLASTPGKVIFENDLMQLIQYSPATKTVFKVPIMIVPPWINKFYVLDLTPEKSFIKWCVDQGLTVFVISWVNPDGHLAAKTFEDYMDEGPLAALDAIKKATGENKVHAAGYCVGGTLLAITLAHMAANGDQRIATSTFFASQVDFTYSGDLKVFADEEQISALEKQMAERGYLDSRKMANTFNLMRSNDLIWPYIINNYFKGKSPPPFDLLYWNADATRMPAANHSFYLRNCYLENKLARGEMEIAGQTLDLKKVKTPVYNLATREDHIAPAKSVLFGSKFFGGPVRFVLSGSGHIAGVINPPDRQKYQYWTGAKPTGADVNKWRTHATEHPGSWWPDWLDWLKSHSKTKVAARKPGSGKLKPIEDAPGRYVKVRD
jgi:polyhydroxyalkanoate synthase subunit PhaC